MANATSPGPLIMSSHDRLLDQLICKYEWPLATWMPAASQVVGHLIEIFCITMDLVANMGAGPCSE